MRKVFLSFALLMSIGLLAPSEAAAQSNCVVVTTSPGNYVDSCSDPTWASCDPSNFWCNNAIEVYVRSTADAYCQSIGDYILDETDGEVLRSGSNATFGFHCIENPAHCHPNEECNGVPYRFGSKAIRGSGRSFIGTIRQGLIGIKRLFGIK